jgi:hypothetical protein
MSGILVFFAIWFLVSIPASLLIGAKLANRPRKLQPANFARYVSPLETTEIPLVN